MAKLDKTSISPALLCSNTGWLTDECLKMGVPFFVERFPASRTLYARLIGNRIFSKRIFSMLEEKNFMPHIIFANDHWEGLLGVGIEREVDAKKMILLRSPGMKAEDFFKYKCREYDFIGTIGDQLYNSANTWDGDSEIEKIYDGIDPSEFDEPKPRANQRPDKILVIGSDLDWKGWADLCEAVGRLQKEVGLNWKFDFPGNEPDRSLNDLKLEKLKAGTCRFLGRREGFKKLVQEYDLVINPSRQETFGMAAVEVLAAGVPLLSTRTGVMEKIQTSDQCLVPPSSTTDLAAAIKRIYQNWDNMDFQVAECQKRIRNQFLIGDIATRWENIFSDVLNS